MPITISAKKTLRKSRARASRNRRKKEAVRDAVKTIHRTLKVGKRDDARALFIKAQQRIDKSVKRGVMSAPRAAREKSRLARLLNADSQGQVRG